MIAEVVQQGLPDWMLTACWWLLVVICGVVGWVMWYLGTDNTPHP